MPNKGDSLNFRVEMVPEEGRWRPGRRNSTIGSAEEGKGRFRYAIRWGERGLGGAADEQGKAKGNLNL